MEPSKAPPRWWVDAALLAGFVALSAALARGHLLTLDLDVARWVDDHRPAPLYWLARVLNYLGQGGQVLMPLAVLLAATVIWRRRVLWPALLFGAAFVLTAATIGPLKLWFDRAAPHSLLTDRAVLFNSDAPPREYLLSYPSGHVANALVWYLVIALLADAVLDSFGRPPLSHRARTALRVLPPVVVFVTTTYLAFHWITDSVAGLLLGLVLARLMARVRWQALDAGALRTRLRRQRSHAG